MADIPQSCIYDWKYGRSKPQAGKIKLIAKVLGISAEEIIDDYVRKE